MAVGAFDNQTKLTDAFIIQSTAPIFHFSFLLHLLFSPPLPPPSKPPTPPPPHSLRVVLLDLFPLALFLWCFSLEMNCQYVRVTAKMTRGRKMKRRKMKRRRRRRRGGNRRIAFKSAIRRRRVAEPTAVIIPQWGRHSIGFSNLAGTHPIAGCRTRCHESIDSISFS